VLDQVTVPVGVVPPATVAVQVDPVPTVTGFGVHTGVVVVFVNAAEFTVTLVLPALPKCVASPP
jgi:hypothetical protein